MRNGSRLPCCRRRRVLAAPACQPDNHGAVVHAAQPNLLNAQAVFLFRDADAAADCMCPICMGPLELPTQVICQGVDEGHRVCKECLEQLIASGNRRCPRCNIPCAPGVKDGLLERRMKEYEVKCNCCGWCGPWKDRASHALACEAAANRLGWKCPLFGCAFTARTEREVEAHLLAGFQEHLELARPAARAAPLHPDLGCKDTAQVYIPDVAAFHARGDALDSPIFIAGGGYTCLVTATPREEECIEVALRFWPRDCYPEVAPFPFPRPFKIMIINPDRQADATSRYVGHHLTTETRHTDVNICPPANTDAWTSGISGHFMRQEVQAINGVHIIIKLFVM